MSVYESMSPAERKLRASSAGHASWANTADRAARTRKGTEAFLKSFETKVDPDGVLPPAERARRADSAKKAHMANLAREAAKRRRTKRGQKTNP